ncbi:MAG: winged helix-turn-helix domain-containing protein [Candidatus Nezhaarchaeales archaeon]
MSIESLLGSKARVRILRVLIEKEELNITAIAREAEVNYKTVTRHLEDLKKTGIITEKIFGRIRVFRINLRDPRVEVLMCLFKSMGDRNESSHG